MSTPTPPNLGLVIPSALVRRIIYALFVIALVVAGALEAWYIDPDPEWLQRAVKVLQYLGIPIGTLAIVNVTTPGTPASGQPPSIANEHASL